LNWSREKEEDWFVGAPRAPMPPLTTRDVKAGSKLSALFMASVKMAAVMALPSRGLDDG
jgi:hypothetical protein